MVQRFVDQVFEYIGTLLSFTAVGSIMLKDPPQK
ncbi:hypothetical protein Br6_03588 [Rhodococcus sp. Br-6]|jgi:hypothetical protein|nr:hypothetical protein Br6_03588 [Rhodococcus sp. Br-6]